MMESSKYLRELIEFIEVMKLLQLQKATLLKRNDILMRPKKV